jgi:hypothetical protein
VHGQAFEQDRQGLDFYFEVVMQRLVLIALFAGLLGGARLLAHHSFAAEFDDKQPIKLTGTLKKVEWTNPHIWYYVEVKNPDGTAVSARNNSWSARSSTWMDSGPKTDRTTGSAAA